MEIVFFGGVKEVGVLCVLIKVCNKNIFIDFGIRMKEDKFLNLQFFCEFGGVDVCFILYVYFDYIGSFFFIVREYFYIFFYVNQLIKDLIKVFLYDSLRIMEIVEDEIFIYVEKNVEDLFDRIFIYGFNYIFEFIEGIKVIFFLVGYIFGVFMIFIQI